MLRHFHRHRGRVTGSPRLGKAACQLTPAVTARGVGEEGFVTFLGQLVRLGVLNQAEKLAWLALHGAVMRATLPLLDDGRGIDEEELGALAREFGGELE